MNVFVREFKVIQVSKKGMARTKNAQKKEICLGCSGELGERPIRGLCSACYQAARRLIRLGETDEKQLIKHGHLLPAKTSGRPRIQRFPEAS